MNFDWQSFWTFLFSPTPAFLRGFALTIAISLVSMLAATALGTLVALAARSRVAPLRLAAGAYIWLIRGTPLLVQLIIIYLGFASLGIFRFSDVHLGGVLIAAGVQAGIVGLTIHESAYIAEIVRAAIEAVDEGQMEAGVSLGLRPATVMRRLILPQAARTMVPPLGNIFNGLMKTTSVLSIIGVNEMFLVAQGINALTFRTFEIYVATAIYYLALTTVWTVAQSAIERRLNARVGAPPPPSIRDRLFAYARPARPTGVGRPTAATPGDTDRSKRKETAT